jgi:hypothetical protein
MGLWGSILLWKRKYESGKWEFCLFASVIYVHLGTYPACYLLNKIFWVDYSQWELYCLMLTVLHGPDHLNKTARIAVQHLYLGDSNAPYVYM